MNAPVYSALAAWRRRGDVNRRDALWVAACWEQAGADLMRVRPRCLSATYTPDAEEKRLRAAEAKRNRAAEWNGKRTVNSIVPYLHAGPELALDLTARQRVEHYLAQADEAIAEDAIALIEVVAEEERAVPKVAPPRSAWPKAARGAW